MRIAIDVLPLQTDRHCGGIGHYLRNVLQRFSRLDGENDYTFLLSNSENLTPLNAVSRHLKKHYLSRKHCLGRWWWRWDTVSLPMAFVQKDIDVYHYNSATGFDTLFPLLPFNRRRIVTTVYDVGFLKFPHRLAEASLTAHSRPDANDSSWKVRHLRRSDAIITLSEASKRDIAELLAYPRERIFIAPYGISPHFSPGPVPQIDAAVQEKYRLPDSFILYVGRYDSKRKNIDRLLHAYSIVRQRVSAPLPALVLTGLCGDAEQDSLCSVIRQCHLSPHVIPLPAVPEDELPSLYRTAKLFVCPSLYEGFAHHTAQALACGTVAVVPYTSSFPEIAGDAGLYFDPCNPQVMADTLYQGLVNVPLRQILQRKGPQQVGRFSWEHAAQVTLSVYKHVHCS